MVELTLQCFVCNVEKRTDAGHVILVLLYATFVRTSQQLLRTCQLQCKDMLGKRLMYICIRRILCSNVGRVVEPSTYPLLRHLVVDRHGLKLYVIFDKYYLLR
jgi:hypothetical protein